MCITRMEDWTCLGQHKRQPEFPVVTRESRPNSRKTTWLPPHRKMKPFPARAPQEKSHVRNWRSPIISLYLKKNKKQKRENFTMPCYFQRGSSFEIKAALGRVNRKLTSNSLFQPDLYLSIHLPFTSKFTFSHRWTTNLFVPSKK